MCKYQEEMRKNKKAFGVKVVFQTAHDMFASFEEVKNMNSFKAVIHYEDYEKGELFSNSADLMKYITADKQIKKVEVYCK